MTSYSSSESPSAELTSDETGDTDNLKQFNTVSIRGFLDFFAKFSNRINLLDLGD
jgi:hypothetical protein